MQNDPERGECFQHKMILKFQRSDKGTLRDQPQSSNLYNNCGLRPVTRISRGTSNRTKRPKQVRYSPANRRILTAGRDVGYADTASAWPRGNRPDSGETMVSRVFAALARAATSDASMLIQRSKCSLSPRT